MSCYPGHLHNRRYIFKFWIRKVGKSAYAVERFMEVVRCLVLPVIINKQPDVECSLPPVSDEEQQGSNR